MLYIDNTEDDDTTNTQSSCTPVPAVDTSFASTSTDDQTMHVLPSKRRRTQHGECSLDSIVEPGNEMSTILGSNDDNGADITTLITKLDVITEHSQILESILNRVEHKLDLLIDLLSKSDDYQQTPL